MGTEEQQKRVVFAPIVEGADTLLNNLPIGIGVFEIIDGVIHQRHMNDGFYRLVRDERTVRQQRTGGDFYQGVYPEDRVNIANAIQQVKDGNDYVVTTCRAYTGDQGLQWLRLFSSAVKREEGYILVYTTYTSMTEEMEARKELEQSHTLLNQALDSAGMVVWEYDPVKKVLTQTEGCANLTGYKDHQIYNMPESMIAIGHVHESCIAQYRQFFQTFTEEKRHIQGDFRIKNGETGAFWWEHVTLIPIFDDTGTLIKGVGTSINVSEQKEQEQRYKRQIYEMEELDAPNMISKGQYDITENQILFYQRKADLAMELNDQQTYDQIIEWMLDSAVDADLLRGWLSRTKLIDHFQKGKLADSFCYSRYGLDGTIVWCEIRYVLMEEPESHHIVVFVYTYDVTERMLSEQIIQKVSALEYDALGLIDLPMERFSLANIGEQYGHQLFAHEGSYETDCKQLVLNQVAEAERASMSRKLTLENLTRQLEKTPLYFLTYFTEANGKTERKRIQFTYLDESQSKILFCMRDITDLYNQEQQQLKQTEQALLAAKAANKAKTDFFSNMSHDMRTPMNGILGLAALMKERDSLEEMKQDADQILLSGRYLLNLINDTLDMSKIESGNLELHLQPINSEDVVQNVLSSAALMTRERGQTLRVHTPDIRPGGWVSVMADASRLEQIFMNVISNAVKYTPEGGQIDIIIETISITDTTVTDKYIIRDNGIGMDEEFLPHIFDSFSQEGRIRTERQSGTGLGMAIVKRLVDLMQGEIYVKSRLNEGTEVTLVLSYPISTMPVKLVDVQEMDDSILLGKTVLLCEDHPLNSQIVCRLLKKKGVNVTTAENGAIGLQLFRDSSEREFAAILMDVRMPVMDGLEATRAIRQLDRVDARTVPIIAMTANAFAEDVQNCLDAGMDVHLSKPLDVDKLYRVLAEKISTRSGG